ncbi:MAG: hypothetical protein Q8P89_01320 [bacterium]|nr:hypothetical protein [bacterium]
MKEGLSNASQIQEKLWGKLCGTAIKTGDKENQNSGLFKRVRQARGGHLPQGLTLPQLSEDDKGFERILGDFAPRVLAVSNPGNPLTLVPEQIAIAGGWCALRTKDVALLDQEGLIMDPESGRLEPISSVGQVTSWIERSISFDQIVESVGAACGEEYVVISERKLWTQRLTAKLEARFRRKLISLEKNWIEKAIEKSERARAEMTRRYLQFATGNQSLPFQRVVDDDVWEDLKRAKTETLAAADLTEERLCEMFPGETPVIKSATIVWAMYSQPYFEVLRENGFISKKKVFIVEPSLHAWTDNRAANEVVQRIYQDRGKYLDPSGINADTGFIAFIECVSEGGVNVRKNLGVGEVPNISNWRQLFEDGPLALEKNLVIEPRENKLFLWGVNFLPFGPNCDCLLRLTELQEEFIKEKGKINMGFGGAAKKDPAIRESLQRKVNELRQEILEKVRDENEQIAGNLKGLLSYLTGGIV